MPFPKSSGHKTSGHQLSQQFDPLWVNFCGWCEIRVQLHFLYVGIQFSQSVCWKESFPPWSWYPIENHLSVFGRAYFWTIHSGPWVYMSVLMPLPLHLDDCSFVGGGGVCSQEGWVLQHCSFSRLFWLFSIHWNSQWVLLLQKNVIRIYTEVALNL